MACIEFEHNINETECIIYADEFTEDPSVGIGLGPEALWAQTPDGQEVEIPEHMISELVQIANELLLTRESDDLEWE